eukprot:452759-Amphidinium_carterae.1
MTKANVVKVVEHVAASAGLSLHLSDGGTVDIEVRLGGVLDRSGVWVKVSELAQAVEDLTVSIANKTSNGRNSSASELTLVENT